MIMNLFSAISSAFEVFVASIIGCPYAWEFIVVTGDIWP